MYTEVKKHFVAPPAPQPFWIELTGTSYCDETYRISRTLQAANVYGSMCRQIVDVYGLSNTVHIKNCDVRRPLQELIDTANSLDLKESEIMTRCAGKFVEVLADAALKNNTNQTNNAEANILCDFLNANTQRMVSVAELSHLIYRSPDYTIKLFKRTFGYTPYDYQIRQKMNICKRRLCTSDDSISDIAYELGYADPQHFSKLFKSRCGISPRQYRNTFLLGKEE